jgi:hypothetical protein
MDINWRPWMQEHNKNFQLECSPRIKGCSHIKQAKKNVRLALKTVKIEKTFMFTI